MAELVMSKMFYVMTNTCLYGMFYRFHTVCLSSAFGG